MFIPVPPQDDAEIPGGSLTGASAAHPTPIHGEIRGLLEQGYHRGEVVKVLLDRGYDADTAAQLIKQAQAGRDGTDERRDVSGLDLDLQALRQIGQRNMLIGGLVCVVGLGITLGTLAAASGSRGGPYIIAWGAIVFGAIQFFRGVGQLSGK